MALPAGTGKTAMADFTRNGIIAAFQDMLETTPFSKITVSGIIEKCGISRNTFYYHFHDIYDLLDAWLYKEESHYLRKAVQCDSWQDIFKAVLQDTRENKTLVRHIFDALSRERLEQYVFESTDESMYKIVCKEAEGLEIDKEDLQYIADFFRYACLGFFLRYLWSDMSLDTDTAIDRLSVLFDGSIRKAAQNAADRKRRQSTGGV
jgi:probable dihydroxyacetone kinase regulator